MTFQFSTLNKPIATDSIWRFSVTQYHQMIDLGILTSDDPVELLEGWIVQKMPKNPPHRLATNLTRSALEKLIPPGYYIDTQEPITLEDSEPEPDIIVVRGNTRDYSDRHPHPSDLALVIEVADSTLERDWLCHAKGDRLFKKRLYARAKIATYWIINLPEQQLEVYTDPVNLEEPTYQQRQDYQILDEVAFILEEREIGRFTVRDLLQ